MTNDLQKELGSMNAATPLEVQPKRAVRGFFSEAWHRFRKRRMAMLGLSFIVLLAFTAVFSPAIVGTRPIVCRYKGNIYFPCLQYFNSRWQQVVFFRDQFADDYPTALKKNDPDSWAIWPLVYQDPYRRVVANEWPGQPGNEVGSPPNSYNLMGTDHTGADVFAQLVHGSRIALMVGFVSTGISALIGITVGAAAGYFGGWVDMLLGRTFELVACIPSLVLILALLSIVDRPTIWHVMVVIGSTGWTTIARLTRSEFLKLREVEYVTAARALGATQFRVMFLHILPNALAPVLVPITFGVASAIMIESGLKFLGFGIDPSEPSWGKLLNAGRGSLTLWWLIFYPGLAIFITVLANNLIGEGIQEATDPRLREATK